MIRARPLVLALALAVGSGAAPAGPVAASGAPPAAGAATADATRVFRMNLAGPRDFVRQSNYVQCVGASIQMMLNIVHPGPPLGTTAMVGASPRLSGVPIRAAP